MLFIKCKSEWHSPVVVVIEADCSITTLLIKSEDVFNVIIYMSCGNVKVRVFLFLLNMDCLDDINILKHVVPSVYTGCAIHSSHHTNIKLIMP